MLAAVRPGAPAVLGTDEELTYAQLQDRATRLAGAVLERTDGAAPGAVALLLDPDAPAIVSAVATLEAGGHYVALDPYGPPERAAAVLADTAARVLLTEPRHAEAARHLVARLPDPPAVVDVTAVTRYPGAGEPPRPSVSPTDRAVIVLTSGSTGRPKLVWHDRAALTAGAATYAGLVDLRPTDRLSLLHGLGTMASVTTLWGALLNGAAVVPRDPRRASRDQLLQWIAARGVTGLHLVPTLFRRLLAGEVGATLDDVRFVRLGGETITHADWDLWRRRCAPASRLHVGLATSETGLIRHGVYDRDTPAPGPVLPVGGPVPGRTVTVVDDRGVPVPPGAVGCVVVRGRHLFGGYHGLPQETAAVRTVQPDGTVVFVGGDLARPGADGALHHVGRADGQLKLDGHRVEPGEIEAALRSLPWARDAAVVARPGPPGTPVRLAAFVVAADDGTDDRGRRAVRAHLRERLPPALLPTTVETLDALPLLPGGKVDRAALAARSPGPAPPAVPPSNPVQETLLEIWERVLGVPVPGVDADFFLDLGGDSLDAVQVLVEIEELLGPGASLDVLARASTVAALADLLTVGWAPPADGALVLRADGDRPPLFGICGLFGHALRLLLVGQALDPDRPFHALQPPGMDWDAAGRTTIDAMVDAYLEVVTTTQARGPYHLLGTSFGGLVAFHLACRLRVLGEDVALLALVDTQPPDRLLPDGIDRAPVRDHSAAFVTDDPIAAAGVRVARQHLRALEDHVLQDRFDGELLYLACAEPPVAPQDDRRLLWSHHAAAVRRVTVPGWHGSFHREPQLSAVAAALRSSLGVAT